VTGSQSSSSDDLPRTGTICGTRGSHLRDTGRHMAHSNDVFISYAADTKPLAVELTLALQREGIDTWADFKDLKPGQLWKDEIEHALENAQSVVILLSADSQSTRWTDLEWRLALTKAWSDADKVLIPVLVGESETPPFLRDWVSLRIDPNAEPQWTADILTVLRSARNRVVQGTGNRDRQERRARLDEIARATEEMRRNESLEVQADADLRRGIV
jgi:hypothetical protein